MQAVVFKLSILEPPGCLSGWRGRSVGYIQWTPSTSVAYFDPFFKKAFFIIWASEILFTIVFHG